MSTKMADDPEEMLDSIGKLMAQNEQLRQPAMHVKTAIEKPPSAGNEYKRPTGSLCRGHDR